MVRRTPWPAHLSAGLGIPMERRQGKSPAQPVPPQDPSLPLCPPGARQELQRGWGGSGGDLQGQCLLFGRGFGKGKSDL